MKTTKKEALDEAHNNSKNRSGVYGPSRRHFGFGVNFPVLRRKDDTSNYGI